MMKLKISKTMAGKTAVKAFLAVALLAGPAAVPAGDVSAAGVKATAAPAVQSTAPVMRDNLSKYGLVKDIELPVTVTAGGLSYTLEKIMIYDKKSKDAQSLIKKYGYTGTDSAKYFIWTKITVENKSGNTVQKSYKDLSEKWTLNFGGDYSAYVTMPESSYYKTNSTEALWSWNLASGKKLSTYQAYMYNEDFNEFYVTISNKGNQSFVEIVKVPKK